MFLISLGLTGDWRPPEVATTRKAFEAAYPKATVSGAALELEALAARLGIDAAPEDELRGHPDPVSRDGAHRAVVAAGEYLRRELEEPSERIGPPNALVAQFLEANASTIDAIAAVASGQREIAWDLDVARGSGAPIPNMLGLARLQRVLGAKALLQLRADETDAALRTIDGMWRICESLAARPELLAHLAVISQARLVVGLLRKVNGPAFGWAERLRDKAFFLAFLASFQNDPWLAAEDPDARTSVETLTRIYRRFADGLIEKSACEWTQDELARSWEVAVSGESDPKEMIMTIASDSIIDMVLRSHRLLLDCELTAMILEARIDRFASREGQWPERIANLESSLCPGHFYTYRRSGGMALAFEGRVPTGDRGPLVLPLKFRGAAPPAPTPTRTPALTPSPTPHTLPAS